MLTNASVLLVDDDREFVRMVARYLEGEGFTTTVAHDGGGALEQLSHAPFDVMVLDLMMPGMSGHDVLRRTLSQSSGRPRVPVLLLSAKGDEVDRVIGLEAGADDYLPKPCALRELAARLRAILRRSLRIDLSEPQTKRSLSFGPLTLDTASRQLLNGGTDVPVTDTEYSIVLMLMEYGGMLVSKEHLTQFALGRPHTPYDRSLDVHIANLRRKIGADESGRSPIRTIRGRGYLLATASGA